MIERCECTHTRDQHADRTNRLQVTPLSMTEADENDTSGPRISSVVHGAGECTVAGCGCRQFTPSAQAPDEFV